MVLRYQLPRLNILARKVGSREEEGLLNGCCKALSLGMCKDITITTVAIVLFLHNSVALILKSPVKSDQRVEAMN